MIGTLDPSRTIKHLWASCETWIRFAYVKHCVTVQKMHQLQSRLKCKSQVIQFTSRDSSMTSHLGSRFWLPRRLSQPYPSAVLLWLPCTRFPRARGTSINDLVDWLQQKAIEIHWTCPKEMPQIYQGWEQSDNIKGFFTIFRFIWEPSVQEENHEHFSSWILYFRFRCEESENHWIRHFR